MKGNASRKRVLPGNIVHTFATLRTLVEYEGNVSLESLADVGDAAELSALTRALE